MDHEVAKVLAAEVIEEEPFSLISEENFQKAKKRMETCSRVICCVDVFGPANEKNRQLMELAEASGKLEIR